MKNNKTIIIFVILGLGIVGFFGYSYLDKQKKLEENRALYNDYKNLLDTDSLKSCEHNVDIMLVPEITDLESECHYNIGMELFVEENFTDAKVEFELSQTLSNVLTDENQEMLDGIELIKLRARVGDTLTPIKYDVENNFKDFYDLKEFIDAHPFKNSDSYLYDNRYLPQITNNTLWNSGNIYMEFYEGAVLSNIQSYGSANSPVTYITNVDWGWDDGSGLDESYGVIMITEQYNGNQIESWKYRYRINIDSIEIYSYITKNIYILEKGSK